MARVNVTNVTNVTNVANVTFLDGVQSLKVDDYSYVKISVENGFEEIMVPMKFEVSLEEKLTLLDFLGASIDIMMDFICRLSINDYKEVMKTVRGDLRVLVYTLWTEFRTMYELGIRNQDKHISKGNPGYQEVKTNSLTTTPFVFFGKLLSAKWELGRSFSYRDIYKWCILHQIYPGINIILVDLIKKDEYDLFTFTAMNYPGVHTRKPLFDAIKAKGGEYKKFALETMKVPQSLLE